VWLLQLSYPQTNTFLSRNHLCMFVSLYPVYFRNNFAGIYTNHGRLLLNCLQLTTRSLAFCCVPLILEFVIDP